MNKVCRKIKNQIGDLFSCSEFNNFIKISTPFLYADGDIINIFYKEVEKGYILTDFGDTLETLESSTATGSISRKQEKIIKQICTNNNLKFNGEMIIGKFDNNEKLANKLINISQSMVEISNLRILNRSRKIRNMIDIVEDFIKGIEIEYKKNKKYTGYTNRIWQPNFSTEYKNNHTLIHILNAEKKGETKDIIAHVNMQWQDLESYKTSNKFKFISLIIDTEEKENNWTKEDTSFLKKTSEVKKWSNKEDFKKALMTA